MKLTPVSMDSSDSRSFLLPFETNCVSKRWHRRGVARLSGVFRTLPILWCTIENRNCTLIQRKYTPTRRSLQRFKIYRITHDKNVEIIIINWQPIFFEDNLRNWSNQNQQSHIQEFILKNKLLINTNKRQAYSLIGNRLSWQLWANKIGNCNSETVIDFDLPNILLSIIDKFIVSSIIVLDKWRL